MAAKEDTDQLIRREPESEEEHDSVSEDSDDGPERPDGDGNSEGSDSDGGVNQEPQPPIGVYDHVAPEVENNKEKKGPWHRRAGKAVVACLIGCCHDCKTMDKVIFVFHILLILVGLAVGAVTTMSKMSTHNQCYLKAHYHSDGSMDYTHELYWCDALLYDSLITMSLGFLFAMVNWTAQLNKNVWWVWIKMGLHVAGWLMQVGSGVMLLIAFFSWCSSMESAMTQDDFHPAEDDNKCLRAARYFDEDKNEESTLTDLYSYTLISLGVALLAALVWTITLVLAIAHFCEFLYRKQDEHEDQEEDDYHLNDGDSDSDEEEGYQYPPYDENLVRQRRIAAGYNLNIQDGEEGAVGGAVGGTGLGNRDIAA